MGVGARLEEIVKKRGTNLHRLAVDSGVPYQTLHSVVKRDSDKIEIDYLIRISHTLGVSTEAFSSEPKNIDPRLDKLIEYYKGFNDEGIEKLLDYAKDLTNTKQYIKNYKPDLREEA